MRPFHHLPTRTGSAAENMAVDFLLLKRYPDPGAVRFRHYDWRNPAFTFGYGQKIGFIRERIPDPDAELVRRPTGGGLVDHRNDWTYALVLPRGHPLCAEPAPGSYRAVHEVICDTLASRGHPVALKVTGKPNPQERAAPPGICFQEPEISDVIHSETGAKIAGAAQKRTADGLLFQGSLERASLPDCDWDELGDRFAERLASVLDTELRSAGWPEFSPDEESWLTAQYASEEWRGRK